MLFRGKASPTRLLAALCGDISGASTALLDFYQLYDRGSQPWEGKFHLLLKVRLLMRLIGWMIGYGCVLGAARLGRHVR